MKICAPKALRRVWQSELKREEAIRMRNEQFDTARPVDLPSFGPWLPDAKSLRFMGTAMRVDSARRQAAINSPFIKHPLRPRTRAHRSTAEAAASPPPLLLLVREQ